MDKSDAILAVHALLAVSPSGGGSPTYTLARKLMLEYCIDSDNAAVCRMIASVCQEYLENDHVTEIPWRPI